MHIDFIPFDENYLNDLIRIHRLSFKDHFNSKLGNNYVKHLLKWFAYDKEYKSIFLLGINAETKELIGYMCGALDGFQHKLNNDLVIPILLSFITHPHLIVNLQFWKLFRSKLRAFAGKVEHPEFLEFEKKMPNPIFSVNAFALEPSFREKGFGVFLLDKFFEKFFNEVIARGLKTVSATIRVDNKPIFTYYKMRKWISAPVVTNSGTLNFYKIIE